MVAGLFDPLTALQARRLADFASNGRKLIAIVLDSEDALFSAEARAALIAALREVSAVAIANSSGWCGIVPDDRRIAFVVDPEGDRARTAEFIQFVLSRQNA